METKNKTNVEPSKTKQQGMIKKYKDDSVDVAGGQVGQDISEDGVEQHNTARKLHHKAFTKAMKSYSTSPNHTEAMKDQTTHAKTMKDLEKKHGLKLNKFGGAYKMTEDRSSWHTFQKGLNEYGGPKQPLVPLPKKKPAVTFSPVIKDKIKEEVGGAKVKPNYWGSKEKLEKGRADQKIKDAQNPKPIKLKYKDQPKKMDYSTYKEASCGMNPNVKEYNDKEKKMVKEDREVSMAVSQLKTMCEYGTDLIKTLEAKGPDYNIEAWVQSTITKAADYMNSVGHYMENEPETKNEDAPANASGGGAIAGVGVGAEGEPGVMLPRKKNKKDAVMGFAAFNRKTPV